MAKNKLWISILTVKPIFFALFTIKPSLNLERRGEERIEGEEGKKKKKKTKRRS